VKVLASGAKDSCVDRVILAIRADIYHQVQEPAVMPCHWRCVGGIVSRVSLHPEEGVEVPDKLHCTLATNG